MREIWRTFGLCHGRENEYDTDNLPKAPTHKADAAKALCAGCPALVGCLRAAYKQPPVGIVQGGLAWPNRTSDVHLHHKKVAVMLGLPAPTKPRGNATDTHCANGHEWNDDTRVLVIRNPGHSAYPRCRECQREASRATRARKTEMAVAA